MFWDSNEKKAKKAMLYWSGQANNFISETDEKLYARVEEQLKSNLSDEQLYLGKYVIRLVTASAIAGMAFREGEILKDANVAPEFINLCRRLPQYGSTELQHPLIIDKLYKFPFLGQVNPIPITQTQLDNIELLTGKVVQKSNNDTATSSDFYQNLSLRFRHYFAEDSTGGTEVSLAINDLMRKVVLPTVFCNEDIDFMMKSDVEYGLTLRLHDMSRILRTPSW